MPHAFIEDTTRHNITQMTSASKVYIFCFSCNHNYELNYALNLFIEHYGEC